MYGLLLVLAQAIVVDEPAAPAGPAADAAATGNAVAKSRLIYLNPDGVTVSPGANDSRRNRSSLASRQAAIPAWNASAELWSETVSCIQNLFAPFDVRFTQTDPGDVPHIEAVFGGNGTMLGLPVRPAGASPFSTTCRVIENSIVFAFVDDLRADARQICEVMAQEIAHSYGLDHELLASDPMSYLSYDGERSFQDVAADCGESSRRPCGVPGYAMCREQQNSYALLLERLGPAVPPSDDSANPNDEPVPEPMTTTDELGCSTADRPSVWIALALLALYRRAKIPRRRAVRRSLL